jgi:hypothetical protein
VAEGRPEALLQQRGAVAGDRRKLAKVRSDFDDVAVYVTGVTPPAGLVKANREWVSSVKLISSLVDSYVSGFKDKDSAVVYRLDNNQGGCIRSGRCAQRGGSRCCHARNSSA